MTRSDLVAVLAERFGQLTQRDSEFAVKTILDAMSDALARGHRIEIRGFGSFSISRRPPRLGRNPRQPAPRSRRWALPHRRLLPQDRSDRHHARLHRPRPRTLVLVNLRQLLSVFPCQLNVKRPQRRS